MIMLWRILVMATTLIVVVASVAGKAVTIENNDPPKQELDELEEPTTVLHVINMTTRNLPGYYFRDLGLTSLTFLSIEESNLVSIDRAAFDGLDHLSTLILSGNHIKSVHPETFSRLTTLNILTLSENDLEDVSLELSYVGELDLSGNRIQEVREGFLQGDHVLFVNLSSNRIDFLNSSLKYLPELNELDISGNDMRGVASHVLKDNHKLDRVHASGNKLHRLAGLQLSTLVFLDLSRNRLDSIDDDFFDNMENLKQLLLNDNDINFLGQPFVHLTELRHLDLSDNEILELPNTLFAKNYQLETLRLSENEIMKLSPFVEPLDNLHTLDLSHNSISEISDRFFGQTSQLATLDLGFNRLTSARGLFKGLKKLINLYLPNNLIVFDGDEFVFPSSLSQTLHRVNLSSNNLDVSLAKFDNNKRLNYLDLSGNAITQICGGDLVFRDLIGLYLSDNKITDLSCLHIGEFGMLDVIDIEGNPLVCNSELDDTIQWLATHQVSPLVKSQTGEFTGDTMGQGRGTGLNESLRIWNNIKSGFCPDGQDIHVTMETFELEEEEMSSFESDESDNSASEESATNIASTEIVGGPGVEIVPVVISESEVAATTFAPPATDTDVPEDEMIQSERRSWEDLPLGIYGKDDEQSEDDDDEVEDNNGFIVNPYHYHWFTVTLILIGISITLICINVAGFVYFRKRAAKRSDDINKQIYTQLYNEVYRDTTETSPPASRSIFVPEKTTKIFLHDKVNELLMNFGLWKRGDEDSESIKKMIVNTTPSSGLQTV